MELRPAQATNPASGRAHPGSEMFTESPIATCPGVRTRTEAPRRFRESGVELGHCPEQRLGARSAIAVQVVRSTRRMAGPLTVAAAVGLAIGAILATFGMPPTTSGSWTRCAA